MIVVAVCGCRDRADEVQSCEVPLQLEDGV